MECLTDALSHCWSDYQHFCTNKKQMHGCWVKTTQLMTERVVLVVFGFSYLCFKREEPVLWWNMVEKICKGFLGFASLSLLPLFSSGLFFLSTATSTSACDCTPSPEVLLDCSLTFCSLNECLNALRNTSFHLEDIFQMLGLEHGELDDKHLIVGNKNFSWSTRPHPYATLAPPPYVIDTPIIDGGPPL